MPVTPSFISAGLEPAFSNTRPEVSLHMTFLADEHYLLESQPARTIYSQIVDLPILDPHSHADVPRIVENEPYTDIWEIEGATDHYVWALMRKRGVPESHITGQASHREKWDALAEIMPEIAGNPTYEWIHLDLYRRFGIEKPISAATAEEIWTDTKEKLREGNMDPQSLLQEMNVDVICSTDDPTDSLQYHAQAHRGGLGVTLRPTWRADRALKIDDSEWDQFVDDLEDATDYSVRTLDDYLDALAQTHDHFAEHGCVASDVGIEQLTTEEVPKPVAEEAFNNAMDGEISDAEARAFRAYVLEFVGELNTEKGWVTQLHLGPVRDYREALYEEIGKDAGGDVATQAIDLVGDLEYFLNRFDGEHEIVLYCLDASHYPALTSVTRAFPNVSMGPAWWFNDNPSMMEHQLNIVGTVDTLANFSGMVSDSRKVMSYSSRFEMFRRSLANVLGEQVTRGQIPLTVAEDLAEHVAHDRPKQLFGF